MSRILRAAPVIVLCASIVAVPSVWAYWAPDGVALCTAVSHQVAPRIASDGTGGAFVTWQDYRGGMADIYAQRVNAAGEPQWTIDGVALCAAAGDQIEPQIIPDGLGGAIVAWQDSRAGAENPDIYAQKVNGSGEVQWAVDGVPLCTAAEYQTGPRIASDGAGGAIVTWSDYRVGPYKVYAQRVNASGVALWTPNGVALCAAQEMQVNPTIAADGAGGAIIAWADRRAGSYYDIYAQRLSASGALLWTPEGVAICTAERHQWNPGITSDGASGAIITWIDKRMISDDQVYVQRVSASGTAQWTTDGVALGMAAWYQTFPEITSDEMGGAVLAWTDSRAGNVNVYTQKVDATGSVQWTASGLVLSTSAGSPTLASDGAGGAIVTWQDDRSGTDDIYAQGVSSSGALKWRMNGVALCSAPSGQRLPRIAPDGTGGGIVAWYDNRAGNSDIYSDIYAQSIDSEGRTGFLAPAIHSVRDVPADEGGRVNVAWDASRADYFSGDITVYTIWRALSVPAALAMVENGAALLSGPEQVSLTAGKPQLRMEQAGGRTFYWELIDSLSAYYLRAYSKIAATAFDSSSAAMQYQYFQIIAHTSDARTFFISAPDSGYSVDNIAPGAPTGLAAEQGYTPTGLALSWNVTPTNDLSHYAVYRGTSEDFVPGPGSRLAAPTEPLWFDASWRWNGGYYYKVSAIDIHGNESSFALLRPVDVTGNDTPKTPAASYLSQNYPNPFNPMTRIVFGLAAPGHVSLKIYDAAGRLVRYLVNEERAAGRYEATWDGRDSSGRVVASGIYFCRLTAGSFEQTKKMALMR